MKQIFVVITSIFFYPLTSEAQYDSIVNSFQKEFDQFRQSAIQEHEDFINHNDSIFLSFLKESWTQVEVFEGKVKEKPKPVEQPVIERDTAFIELDFIQPKEIQIPTNEKYTNQLEVIEPVKFNSRMVMASISYYSTQEKVVYDPFLKPKLYQINQKGIINFFRSMAKHSSLWDYNLKLFRNLRVTHKLNDWGFYQLIKNASETIFDNISEQRLFTWYMLLKSGYHVKVGYDENEVFLLIPTVHQIYRVLYLNSVENNYYIFDTARKEIKNIQTYEEQYPGSEKLFSFVLNDPLKLGGDIISNSLKFKDHEFTFEFYKNEIDFLASYPHCELGTYFLSSMSEKNLQVLDNLFKPMLEEKSEKQKVDILLDFCHHAFEYQTDQEQFGKERYFFADESLFYPYNDCEDRSVLFAKLIKRYTGLESIGIDFIGHVATAVCFNDDSFVGDYYLYKGKKYYVCDPTFINSKSGTLHKDFKSEKPKIIIY